MPRPITPDPRTQHNTNCTCDQCADARIKQRNPHLYGYTEHRSPGLTIAIRTFLVCLILGSAMWAATAWGHEGQVQPVRAPASLLRARQACPNGHILQCRAALRRAYAALEWSKNERLALARQMIGDLHAWTCIHHGEGSWTAHTGNGYFGGLQMDAAFERTYGRDMLQRYHGHADHWPPREQIIVAQRAYSQGRGYAPWPMTSRACGLR